MPRKTSKPTKNATTTTTPLVVGVAVGGATAVSSKAAVKDAATSATTKASTANNNTIGAKLAPAFKVAAAAEKRKKESLSSADSDLSAQTSHSVIAHSALPSNNIAKDSTFPDRRISTPINMAAAVSQLHPDVTDGAHSLSPRNAATPSKSPTPDKVTESKGHPERKRRASNESEDSAITKTSEAADDISNSKDEDDNDDDDDDEKGPAGHNYDPERLKSFNMFVRLFVDENLDRSVPISKQPKDKIQAILEACDRQFPEFHERSRKRIRTYLKSCRRMRRSKEQNGWEPHLRPTPPHLTSAAAEGLLAAACENESQNAKRMRMGLEPLPATVMNAARELGGAAATLLPNPLPPVAAVSTSSSSSSTPQQPQQQQQQHTPSSAPTAAASQTPGSLLERPASVLAGVGAVTSSDFLRHQAPPPAFRAAPEFHHASFFTNGNGLFRPGAFGAYQHPAHHHPATPGAVLQHAPSLTGTAVTNGDFVPTDLSMKKSSSKNQLSAAEVSTIKQLIAGYRESAAFLYRSADELEQLLLQQN